MQTSPEQFLLSHEIFTKKDLEFLLVGRGSKNPASTAESHLHRWLSAKRILQIKRGLYGRAEDPNELDPYLIANKISEDSLLSHHTALEVHGYSQSLFSTKTFLTTHSPRSFTFGLTTYRGIKHPASLLKRKLHNMWVETIERRGEELHLTSLERTVVDLLDRPELGGGFEEVWRSLETIGALRLKEIEAYATNIKSKALFSKLGAFLEKQREVLLVPEKLLKKIEKASAKNAIYVKRSESGRFLKRWNLIIPRALELPHFGEGA